MLEDQIYLGIVTDDPPVSNSVIASGMCRVNNRLFRAINNYTTLIATKTHEQNYNFKDIDNELKSKCIVLDFPKLPNRLQRRLLPNINFDEIAFNLMLPKLVQKLHQSGTDWIFCPCGVNPFALEKGYRLAQASKLPLAVYLVDDFLSGAILSGNNRHLIAAQENIPKWLSKTSQIFVISEGLRNRVQKLYNLDAKVLPLPYELPQLSSKFTPECDKEQVIFIGNLSHFYLDGLRQMAAILDELNKERSKYITLRLTLANIDQAKKLIGDFDCIKCIPCETSESLHQEIASSIMCFAPYSFASKYKEMVSSSFPSKMLDYLSSARFIVTYAPEYATSTLYFQKHGLSTVVSSENSYILRDIVIHQLNHKQNFNKNYREIVKNYHSLEQIATQIISNLS